MPIGTCLNVNIPKGEIKDIKFCRQAKANWQEEFIKHKEKDGFCSFKLAGQFINKEPDSQDTDEWAISNGYISIVPIKADMTDTNFLNTLKNKLYDI